MKLSETTEMTFTTDYDRYIVAFSGGKDSLASVLLLLDLGVPKDRIELHHHDVDGGERRFMDWGSTPSYCRRVAQALGLKIYFSHKVGGFEGEMLRHESRTAPTAWETEDGSWKVNGGTAGKIDTREQYPAQHHSLSIRWCSAYLKIMVMEMMLKNEPRFVRSRTLVITGERAEESDARAKYSAFGPHKADLRDGKNPRHIDHWRPVLGWSEEQVWEIIRRYAIIPHPAYRLGWSRLSCMTCIFGSVDQWATIRAVFPERFERIAARERQFGKTIDTKRRSVHELADRGTPFAAALAQPELVAQADADDWNEPVFTNDWQLPAGAFGESDKRL